MLAVIKIISLHPLRLGVSGPLGNWEGPMIFIVCLKHPMLNIFSSRGGFADEEKDLMRIINSAANPNGLTGDRMGLLTLCQAENHLELSIRDLRVFKKLSQR